MSDRRPEDLCRQAQLLLDSGRHEEAVSLLTEGLSSDPTNPELLGMMGAALSTSGQKEEGRRYLSEALALAPEDPWLLSNLALLTVNKDAREAKALAERAVAVDPNDVGSHLCLAVVLMASTMKRSEIRSTLAKAKELAPTNPEVWVLSGRYHEVIRRRRSARLEYLEALRLQPDHGDALMGLARTEGSVTSKAEVARRAGRTRLDDKRPISELRRQARVRLTGATLIWFAPVAFVFALLMAWLVPPRWAVLAMMIAWVLAGVAVPLRLRSLVAGRWARGEQTWWLADRAIANGKSQRFARSKRLLWVVTIVLVLYGTLAITILALGIPPDGPSGNQPDPRMVLSEEPYPLRLSDGRLVERRVMIPSDKPPRRSFNVTLPDGTTARVLVKNTGETDVGTTLVGLVILAGGGYFVMRALIRRRQRIFE